MARPQAPDASIGEERFFVLTEPLLAGAGVERSTMMGLPCVRWNGDFFASCDRNSGDLLVKLTQARVDELVEASRAHPFAPAGRRFREWAAISPAQSASWARLLDEALAAAVERPPKAKRR